MTFQQFLNKYDKKPIDYDGYYGRQCVDVYDQYCKEVVGCRVILVNGAKDIWNNYPTEAFTRIPNTPAGVPQKGDVMIWGTGQYGHVGIVIDANVNSFTSFDQNWPFDNGTGVAHYQYHNYSGVLGWLRPKKDVNFDQAAYDAEQAKIKQAEADRIAKEEAAKAKAEAERVAKEQAKLEAELKAKLEAEEKAKAEQLKEQETKMLEKLQGKKTFLVAGLMIVLGLLQGDLNLVLEGLGLVGLRLGIAGK